LVFRYHRQGKIQNRKKLKRDHPAYVYCEVHHVIPQCVGGKKTVLLTAREHVLCHWLLIYMPFSWIEPLMGMHHGEIKHKMAGAFWRMMHGNKKTQGAERKNLRNSTV
jgi:hypothetical protein